MLQAELTVGFVAWVLATQCVNFAFYLALTRGAYGLARTVGVYFIYLVTLAVILLRFPSLHGGPHGTAGSLGVGFVTFYSLWGVLALVMSRGAIGRRVFAVLLCGIHQLAAFAVSLLLMHNLKSTGLGASLSAVVMVLMGWALLAWLKPRVDSMPDKTGWLQLDIMAVTLFALLYASGIWPVFVAHDSANHIAVFAVATLVSIVFFPTAFAFGKASRQASALASVEENLMAMAGELRDRRATIAEARRIRNDRRNRQNALRALLEKGAVTEALDYLDRLGELDGHDSAEELVWCENETVNAVLSGYSRKAASAGLRFSALANIAGESGVTEVEMVELVSSLLEVAIATAAKDGEVSCLLRQRRETFGLTVTNTVGPDFRLTNEGLPRAQPDIALGNVMRLVSDRHGLFRYRVLKDVLHCDVLLPVGRTLAAFPS